MSIESMLKMYADSQKDDGMNEKKLQDTIIKSKEAFWKSQVTREPSWMEFLYQQAAYIQKRWWLAQGIVMIILWFTMYLSASDIYRQRSMGILTPCFVILVLPEFWKNRNNNAMEVECAAYFSLQKIYAARLVLFGMVDTCLLSIFCVVSAFTIRMAIMDFLIQFVLPLNVTCCICFQTLQSKKIFSIYSSLILCMGWIMVWVSLVLNDGIYEKISLSVWVGTIVGSFIWLCYSIMRVWKCNLNYYEAIESIN